MRLTTKSRFAVAAMIDLALRERRGPVALAAIGMRQRISLSYLEQMFAHLRRSGLVQSARGPGGGYTLGRAADKITVADIVQAVERPTPGQKRNEAAGDGEAPAQRMTSQLWERLSANMLEYLGSVTLRQLAEEQRARGMVVGPEPAAGRRGAIAPVPVAPSKPTAPNSVFALGEQPAAYFAGIRARRLGTAH